jgi:phosphoserine phosphatase RsbU/P
MTSFKQGEFDQDFEEFFENSLTGFLYVSPEGDIVRANTVFSKWLGESPKALRGRHFSEFLTIAGRIYYDTHLNPLLKMQGFFDEIALELTPTAGGRSPVIVNALESRDETGRPLFVKLTVFKATERRQYESELLAARNELRDLNATLEQRIADEVKERLSLEGRLAEEHETAVLREQFIAVLGHDLRNPLAAIDAGMKALNRTPLNEKAKTVTALVQESVTRMAGLIDDVMDFARARMGGGIDLHRQAVNLDPIIAHVVDELRTAWPGRTINLEFCLPHSIQCDPGRIGQLLSNLVGNALTHGADDEPITVGAFLENELFELYVSNLGEPIPAEAQQRLFQPFARGDFRPNQRGLGLGLYIASEIARAHEGILAVKSTSEETRFTLRMPAVR